MAKCEVKSCRCLLNKLFSYVSRFVNTQNVKKKSGQFPALLLDMFGQQMMWYQEQRGKQQVVPNNVLPVRLANHCTGFCLSYSLRGFNWLVKKHVLQLAKIQES